MSSNIKGGMKRGYYVKGHFVAEGSELDMELKAEQYGSKTRAKAAEKAKQDLGAVLLDLPPKRWAKFDLPEVLLDALHEAKRITDFEGKRRQLQYIGKLMRQVDADALAAQLQQDEVTQRMADAVPRPELAWTQDLLSDDSALPRFIAAYASVDVQQLRSLLRQVQKLRQQVQTLQAAEPADGAAIVKEQAAARRAQQKLQVYVAQALQSAED